MKGNPTKRRTRADLSRRHMEVLRWMLSHPAATQRECARALNYTESTISRICRSDAFMDEYRRILHDRTSAAVDEWLRAKPLGED